MFSSEERLDSMNLATSALAILPAAPATCNMSWVSEGSLSQCLSHMIILPDSELFVSDTVVSQPSRPHHCPVQVCYLGVFGMRLDLTDSLAFTSFSSQISVSLMLLRTGPIMGRRNHLMRNMAWPLLASSVYHE